MPVTATPERRATRRHPFYGDQEIQTPALDALEAERAELAAAEAEESALAAKNADRLARAKAILASGVIEELEVAQKRIEELMAEYVQTYQAAWALRSDVAEAQSTISQLDDEWPSIAPTIALRATVGGEHDLRAVLDTFRNYAMSGGEV